MKKISVFLAIVLLIQSFALPAWAEPTDGISEPTQVTEETIPQNVSGDASVSLGSHSINAQQSIATAMDHSVDASAALVFEMETDTLLYAYNVDQKVYPASLTKIMTCLVALEKGDLRDMVTVSEGAIMGLDPSGSSAALQAGEKMSLKDLLFCLMVKSANDAAMVIAEHISGSTEAFVEEMNRMAAQLGCTGTHFVNPHGLHEADHYTTARDMAKIMLAALEHDTFREAYSTGTYEVPATNLSESRTMHTTNYMISLAMSIHYFDERVVGGKTGFTTPAGRCFISVSEDNGMRLLTVVMGAGEVLNEYGEVLYTYGNFIATRSLLNMAFGEYVYAQVLSPDQVLGQFEVSGGKTGTQGYVKNSSAAILPADAQMSQLRYEYVLDNGGLSYPVAAGQPIGIVRVWHQSSCVAQQELYSTLDVEKQIVAQDSGKIVDPAGIIGGAADLIQILLVVILVLLALILLMIGISYVRYRIIRARRRRRRASRRRSR